MSEIERLQNDLLIIKKQCANLMNTKRALKGVEGSILKANVYLMDSLQR
jgi:hypothetical protein